MIKIEHNTKIYILCAPNFATGGPEALHQLASHLIKIGFDAKMIYFPRDFNTTDPVHPFYKQYQVPYVYELENTSQHFLILPETSAQLVYHPEFSQVKKIIWWLSVINYYKILDPLISEAKRKKSYWLRKFYKPQRFATLKNLKFKAMAHIGHSELSMQHLRNAGINPIGQISDYMNRSFFDLVDQDTKKQDIIIYNPVKNGAFLDQIMHETPELKWVPLVGLSPAQVAQEMNKAKLYVDFGYHPGKERMPREACIMKCCLIIGKDGSAKLKEDMPIDEEFRFDKNQEEIPKIIETIKLCLNDYDQQVEKFAPYRAVLFGEQAAFETVVSQVFVKA